MGFTVSWMARRQRRRREEIVLGYFRCRADLEQPPAVSPRRQRLDVIFYLLHNPVAWSHDCEAQAVHHLLPDGKNTHP